MTFVQGMTANGKAVTDQSHLDILLAADVQIQVPQASGGTTPSGRKLLSKAEAVSLSDANLAESFGLPSSVEVLGAGATFTGRVTAFIKREKRAGKGDFPATQIETGGVKFCVLFDRRHEIGQEANFRLDPSELTRSGLTATFIG